MKFNAMTKDRFIVIVVCIIAIVFALLVEFLPQIYLQQGKKAYDREDYVAAYSSLHKAYLISRRDNDIRYYYAKTLSKLKPTLKVQRDLFSIADSQKNDSARLAAQMKVDELRERFLRQYGENYIEQAPSDIGLVRWDLKSFPLKVYISQHSNSLPKYYKVQIMKALNQWQASIKFLKFDITDDKNSANIIIEVIPLRADVCHGDDCTFVLGITLPSIENRLLKKMTISLYDKDPLGRYFSDKELYNTVLHEMGHALGIMGHSYSSNDLMYMTDQTSNKFFNKYRSSFQYISATDINTLSLLYQMFPDVSNVPISEINTKDLIYAPIIIGNIQTRSSKKLKEAENYIKKVPDMPNGYIDKAVALSEMGQVTNAVKALEKALSVAKQDEDKFVIHYNTAVIYLNNKMPNVALPYALKAQAISNSEEVRSLIADIKASIDRGEDILKSE